MNEVDLLNYLFENGVEDPRAAGEIAGHATKYSDIRAELFQWLSTRQYPEPGLSVESYTASAITEIAPWLDGVGVYALLTSLRDDPDATKASIEAGLPRL